MAWLAVVSAVAHGDGGGSGARRKQSPYCGQTLSPADSARQPQASGQTLASGQPQDRRLTGTDLEAATGLEIGTGLASLTGAAYAAAHSVLV